MAESHSNEFYLIKKKFFFKFKMYIKINTARLLRSLSFLQGDQESPHLQLSHCLFIPAPTPTFFDKLCCFYGISSLQCTLNSIIPNSAALLQNTRKLNSKPLGMGSSCEDSLTIYFVGYAIVFFNHVITIEHLFLQKGSCCLDLDSA